ncbi:MAG: acyl-CoA synthetase [Proteobacteria bacterium]|nr:acyl-CoA synthetase [Pseudomonadota bacterium]
MTPGPQTPATAWNYGDLLDALDAVFPGDAPALIHGDRVVSWSGFARRTNNLAAGLRERGARPDDKVAFYLRNDPAYMETLAACFKARLVHVNVNYRYLDEELWYILDNSDARFVVYSAEFADRVAGLRDRLPNVVAWIQVDPEGAAPVPEWAVAYESLADAGPGAPLGIERSPDDLLFIYTGGTTGMPKGVMWRAADVWGALGFGRNAPCNKNETPPDVATHVANAARHAGRNRQLTACPLMHGTGLLTAIGTLSAGGCIITLDGLRFDPEELFAAVEKHGATSAVIVGDAFAKPMLNCLEAQPGRFDLRSLKLIISSGVMWSLDVKRGLLKHHPDLLLADMFGSSEAVGFGSSVTSAKGESRTARFRIGDRCKVFTEDGREVEPGSGERGFIARTGPIPLGYYKDEKKTAETFRTIDGVRYSVPGDWCTVEADGTLTLLGRGSVCINTAGEKVYPEEVEEALKTHAAVEDALVVGVPDERWGQSVTAVVELAPDQALDEEALRQHVRSQLAGYKTPKRVVAVPQMFRAPNGKANYKAASAHARDALGIAAD